MEEEKGFISEEHVDDESDVGSQDGVTYLQEELNDSAEEGGMGVGQTDKGEGEEEVHGLKAPLREQDRFLPIANVTRIMKRPVPKSGKIAKDARECIQECVSEFISFITSEASERCSEEKRKTINGEDVIFAMNQLGFENYVEPLKLYLNQYREAIKGGDKGPGGSTVPTEPYMVEGGLSDDASLASVIAGESSTGGQQQLVYYPNYIS
ncbi:unnamed protein product [Cyprideis torosa]|uniref:Nuclear transcription factor Y subunit beta n=1 Tax=Cyprideis torosa TaxID=163714 RepID=A0A7R8W6K4_9CRUS|nr:unnamed protein product [Cyprideis torosa]CAG0882401.1 unnamed protein product [Cyprideis torosa]